MKKKKLKGEFVCFEVRDEQKNLIGIDVFYNGVHQYRWTQP